MNPRRKFLLSVLSIPAALRAQPSGFRPPAVKDCPSRRVTGKVTMAAVKYEADDETSGPFGKVNPNEYGVLPVLFIIQNEGDETLLLDKAEIYLQMPDRQRIEPTPAKELPYLRPVKRPNTGPSVPIPIPLPKKKNPLADVVFDARAFVAKTVLRGETAHGFFYFQARYRRGAFLYVNGIREGNKEMFFSEIELDSPRL